jgi:WD40 repeat protein
MGAEEQTTTAKRRQAEAPRLINLIRGDLDWVAMKCLEKDRTRRYETANGLALDIERHLGNEPVVARPPSLAYRVQKAVRRHRLAVAAAGAVTAALVIGTAVSAWQAVLAKQQAVRAEQAQQAEAREAYVAKLALATAKIESGQLSRAHEILESCPAQLRHWEWSWLNDLGGAPPRIIGPHFQEVTGLAFTPDSKRLVTTHVGAPLVWSVDDGEQLKNSALQPPTNYWCYQWLALSKNGTTMTTVPQLTRWGTQERQVTVWNTETGRQLRTITLTNIVETMSSHGSRIFLRNGSNQPAGYTVVEPTTGRIVSSLMATGEFAFRFSHYVGTEEPADCLNPRLPAVSADGRWLLTQNLNQNPGAYLVELKSREDAWGIHRLPLGRSYLEAVQTVEGEGFTRALTIPFTNVPSSLTYQKLRFRWTIWNVEEGRPIARLPESDAPLVFAAFSPDGSILFTWTRSLTNDTDQPQNRGCFWETSTGRPLSGFNFQGRTDPLRSKAVFSGDGTRLLMARNTSPEWPVEIYDAQSGRLLTSLLKYDGELGGLALSADGSMALTADRTVRVWDATKGTEITSFVGHEDRVVCAAFSPDGRWAATGSRDKTARIWPLQSTRSQINLDPNFTFATDIEFAANGRFVLALVNSPANSGHGAFARVWEAETGREICHLEFTNSWERVVLLPDELHLLALNPGNRYSGDSGQAHVYDLLTGRIRHTFQAKQLGLAPGSDQIFSFDQPTLPRLETKLNFTVKIWSAATGMLIATNDIVGVTLDLLLDGKHALTSPKAKSYQLWDLSRQRAVGRLSESPRWGAAFLHFFPNQRRLLFERWDEPAKLNKLVLIESEDNREVSSFVVGTIRDENFSDGLLNVLSVSADGERFVIAHQLESTHRLWLWETKTGKHQELIGHVGRVNRAAFFPDGKRLVTAGDDHTARFWDSLTGHELLAMSHPGVVSAVAVSQDQRSVLSISQGLGTVIWRAAKWEASSKVVSKN